MSKGNKVNHHLRFNITGSLGAIVFFAVGLAALREADDRWNRWLSYLTLGLLSISILLAVSRTGERRAFWIGFALFGWGYLSLSLIPSTRSRLISTNALKYFNKSSVFSVRAYRMRAILDPDRMRARNVSTEDLKRDLKFSHWGTGNLSYDNFFDVVDEQDRVSPGKLGQATGHASQAGQPVLIWGTRYSKPEQFGNILIRANREGEILRLKDVARVEMASSAYIPRLWPPETVEHFIRIGHSLIALMAAWLGGVLSRKLKGTLASPKVPKECG